MNRIQSQMRIGVLRSAAFALLLLSAAAFCQTPYSSTSYFVTPDWRRGAGNFSWDNFVLEDGLGAQMVVTFDQQASAGQGLGGGPTYVYGDYVLHAVTFRENNNGGYGQGHTHFINSSGNPGSYERPHFGAIYQFHGYVIERMDGQAFRLVSLDYRNAPVPLLVGTSYSTFADICTFDIHEAAEGLIEDDPSWRTINLFESTPPPLPPADAGAPCKPGVATIDINTSQNANGAWVNDPCGDLNGPFFATAFIGSTMTFRFSGEPFAPIILAYGPLNPGVATFPIGQFDIGMPNPLPPFLPTGVFVPVNPLNQLDFLSGLFIIGAGGTALLTFSVPPAPPGTVLTFQSAMFSTTTGIPFQLSNAVQLTII